MNVKLRVKSSSAAAQPIHRIWITILRLPLRSLILAQMGWMRSEATGATAARMPICPADIPREEKKALRNGE